jgi:hypothetical protein
MQERRPRKTSAPDSHAPDAALRLAVFHRSDNVDEHVAALQPAE